MPITLKKDVWKVKDPSSGQYRGAAILSTTLPQDAAQIISESNATIQNIKDTAIDAVDTALNDESTGLIPKAEADRDAIDDSLNNATNGIIPTAQSDRDDVDDSLNNINNGIIPEAQANLATIAAAVQSQISQGTDKTLSVAKGFADAKAAGMMVKVSNYQPGSQLDDPATSQDASQNTGYPVYKDSNRVWVKETYAELEVPTMDDVDELKSALTDITGCTSLTGWSEEHYYLITNGSTVDVNSPSYSASYSWRYVVVPCVPGDVFTVNGQGGGVQRLWCFTDALYNVLSVSPQSLIAANLVITAPPSSAFLILNDRSGSKSYSGKTIPNELDEINADVTALDAKIDAVEGFTYTDTDLSFVQEEGYVDCTNGTRSSASVNYARTPFIEVDHNAEYYYTGTIQKNAGICGYSEPNVNYFVASILDRIAENDKYTFVNYKLSIPDSVNYIIASTKVSGTAQIVIKKREMTFTREFENWKNIEEALNRLVDETKTTKVVLVGDSITAGVGGTNYANDGEVIVPGLSYKRNTSGYCWANLFKDYIEGNYNATVLNNGCSGTDSSFLLTYIQTLIPTDTDVVIISYGTNDRKRVVENNRALRISTLTSNMNQIIEYCRNNDIAFIINTPPPSGVADETNVVEGAKRWIHLFDIANYISKICFNNNARVCNVYNAVSKYCRFTETDWEHTCLSDTLHPNDSGYLIMFREIVNLIGLALPYDNIYNVE